MRIRVLFLLVTALLIAAPSASANFMDLPGMDAVESVTPSNPDEADGSDEETTDEEASDGEAEATEAKTAEQKAGATVEDADTSLVSQLPGGGAIPFMDGTIDVGVGSTSGSSPVGMWLVLAAAFGTLVALAMTVLALRGKLGTGL